MALLELLFSVLLLSIVHSAPVESPTETTSENHDLDTTDIEKGGKLATQSVLLFSSRGDLTSPPNLLTDPQTEQSDLVVETNESESLEPNDFVPTDIDKREQAISEPPTYVLPLQTNVKPQPDPGVFEVQENSKDISYGQNTEDGSNSQDSNPKVIPPIAEDNQQAKSLSTDRDEIDSESSLEKQPGGSQGTDKIPFDTEVKDTSVIYAESEFSHTQVTKEDGVPSDAGPSEEPYDDKSPNQTPESFNEGVSDDSHTYSESTIDSKPIDQVQEEYVYEPQKFPTEDDAAKEIPPTNMQYYPETQNNDDTSLVSEPSQIGDNEPTEVVQPKDVEPYKEPVDENSSLPIPDQDPDEQEESHEPPFPVDTPEEMVVDPAELSMREEPVPPVILVKEFVPSPMLSVIQMEQQTPQYANEEIVPLSDDSVKGEIPQEEILIPENSQPEILNFDNRPEESGPMNIL